jgi:hypothetical protein
MAIETFVSRVQLTCIEDYSDYDKEVITVKSILKV